LPRIPKLPFRGGLLLKGFAAAATLILATISPVAAADPAAEFLTKLFTDVCVSNLGQPTKVREWAEQHHLAQMTNPGALGVFVGPGDNGAAWGVPAAEGGFILSIRGMTQGCAVWARSADPGEVRTYFTKIIEGIRRPGIDVTVDKNTTEPSPFGEFRALAYNITAPKASTSFEFILMTAERPGSTFQASMQVATAGAPKTPPR
jgi:hypothetical protein